MSYLFPYLSFVDRHEDMTTDSCRIVPGNGYPNMVSAPKLYGGISRLEACLRDIRDYGNIDYFFICVDSEEEGYQDRFDELNSRLESLKAELGIDQCQSATQFYVIVQHRCIETWALGNAEIPNQYNFQNSSIDFPAFQAYYNTLIDDPELMSGYPPNYSYSTQAKFHEKYLKEYLKKFGLSYSKKKPTVVQDKKYLDALIKRCSSTNHLSSLMSLLKIWEQMKNS